MPLRRELLHHLIVVRHPEGDMVDALALLGDETHDERRASTLFLEGDGWGFGGSVAPDGRYGWVGGTGTAAHVTPSTGSVSILLSQLEMGGPTPTDMMRDFWRYAATT